MEVPLETSFRGFEPEDAVKDLVREKAGELDKLHDNLIRCRVAVEKVQSAQAFGNPFRVRIDVTVPRHELVVKREPSRGRLHDPLHAVIRDAFDSMGRQLKEMEEIQRGNVKAHPGQSANAVVESILRDHGYGFLRDLEGRDVYFHRNSVLRGGFDALREGDAVRYVREEGEKGLQASTVEVVERPSSPAPRPGEQEQEPPARGKEPPRKVLSPRTGRARWRGRYQDGEGVLSGGSGRFEAAYSFPSRFREAAGTGPEELLGAAHAGCFSQALALGLEKAGHDPGEIDTQAVVHLERAEDRYAVTRIDLDTTVRAAGLDEKTLQEEAARARLECPLSRLMKGAEITVTARLG